MFERMEERRASRARSLVLMLTVGTVAAVVIVKLVMWHLAAEAAREHAAYVAAYTEEKHEEERPRDDAFAGIALHLPGEPGIREDARYARGRIVGGRPFEYSIDWAEGSMDSPAARTQLIGALIASTRDPAAVVPPEKVVTLGAAGASRAYEYELHWANHMSLPHAQIVTLLDCDGRYFTFAVDAASRKENDALLGSVRCVPDATAHSTTAHFPVVVDPATGWKRLASPDELELVGPHDVHLHAKLLPQGHGSVLDTIENAAGRVQLRSGSTSRGDKVFMTGWLADSTGSAGAGREVAVLGFRCPNDDVATITIIGKPPLDAGILLGDTARCLGATEVMPQYEK